MAYTDFFCNASTGDNLNGGSDAGSVTYTSTNGNWSATTHIFTPTDGTNPVSAGVTVGQFASIYVDAASAPTAFIARITAVTNAANGAITTSSTATAGTAPATSVTARTIKVGGAWKGPNAATGFPIALSNGGAGTLSQATDSAGDTVRVNFKNNATYSVTTAVAGTAQQSILLLQGYSSTVGDGGRAILDGGGNNISIVTIGQGTYIADFVISNVGVAAGTGTGLAMNSGCQAFRVIVHDVRGTGVTATGTSILTECEVYAFNKSNTAGQPGVASPLAMLRCYIHDGTGSNCDGVFTISGTASTMISNCIFDTLGGNGVVVSSSSGSSLVYALLNNNDFYNNTGAAIKVNAVAGNYFLHIENCNFIKNGTFAINGGSSFTHLSGFMFNNGYGTGTQANGSGNYNTTGSLILDDSSGNNSRVVYASNLTPWNAPSTGDFSLILATAIGSGRGVFTETDGTNTGTVGFPDIGSAQSNAITQSPAWAGGDFVLPAGYLTHAYLYEWRFTVATSFSLISGSLPSGLTLLTVDPDTAEIVGTPTAIGTFTFVLRATVGASTGDATFHITVNADPDEGIGGLLGGLRPTC